MSFGHLGRRCFRNPPVPLPLVDYAVLLFPAGVGEVLSDGPLEKPLAAFATVKKGTISTEFILRVNVLLLAVRYLWI